MTSENTKIGCKLFVIKLSFVRKTKNLFILSALFLAGSACHTTTQAGADLAIGFTGGTCMGTMHLPLAVGGASLFAAPFIHVMLKKLHRSPGYTTKKLTDELSDRICWNIYGALYGLCLGGFLFPSAEHATAAKAVAWTSLTAVTFINCTVVLGAYCLVALLDRVVKTLAIIRRHKRRARLAETLSHLYSPTTQDYKWKPLNNEENQK